ncbi:MAG: ParB N-terminal domain-containing protein [Roseburia sp.]|nr:ParB N-terminal domain-containing protein [Roseburia sp.]
MAFNINDFLNEESKKDIKSDWKPVRISVRKLRPAADGTNFYHIEDKEIKDLAESIELIGLQQYPVVKPIEGTDEYEIIAGHKRRMALLRLLDEGKAEYELVPCKVETPDDIRNELILIFTNSTQRERTDYEKIREIRRVRELLTEYEKNHELTGRKQSIIAEILGTSKTKIGTLDNIGNNLISPLQEEFKAGKISTSAANEAAGLDKGAQEALYEAYKDTGALTAKDAKAIKESAESRKQSDATTESKEKRGITEQKTASASDTDTGKEEKENARRLHVLKMLEKYYVYMNIEELEILERMLEDCKRRKREYGLNDAGTTQEKEIHNEK